MSTTPFSIIVFLGCLVCLKYTAAAVPASRAVTINQPLYSTDSVKNNSVCLTDDLVYNDHDIVPGAGPCEQCICNAPDIVCSVIKCETKSGCKIIQRQNQCCPDYKCDCEYNGRSYNNGEKIDTSDMPCRVCYCKGGDVMCTTVGCYERDDCEGKIVPGTCCPKYDHCPPLDTSTLKPTTINTITPRTGKRGLQPWLLALDAASTINPITELTTLNDDIELSTGITQLPEFSAAAKITNNSTNNLTAVLESSSITGSRSSNASKAENEVKRMEGTAVTETPASETASDTTVDAIKEAVNTVKTTTKSIANEADPFTESIILPYRKDPANVSHTANSFKCSHASPTANDDIITIAFANSEGTEKSDPPSPQSGSAAASSSFIDVEKSTIDIVQQLLDVKTTIEGLATDIPQTTGMSKFAEDAINETNPHPVTESVSEVIAGNAENNLTVRATVVLVDDDKKYANAADDDTVIANVTLLQKNASNFTAANGTTVAPGYANPENGTLADPNSTTADSRESVRITSIGNTNQTISVEHLSTISTSVTMVEANSTNATTASKDSLSEKNAAADTPPSFIASEQNVIHNSSDANAAESTTLLYGDTEVAKVVLVAKNASGSDLWEDVGKVDARVTVTDNEKGGNADSNSVSSESGENYGNATATECKGCDSDSFESGEREAQLSQVSDNKTTQASTQGKPSQMETNKTLAENPEEVKLHATEKPTQLSNSERNVTQTGALLDQSSESVPSVRTNPVIETTPKFEATTNLFEYVTTTDLNTINAAQDTRTNENVNKSVTSYNSTKIENTEISSTTTSPQIERATTQNVPHEIHLNPIRITTQETLQNVSIPATSNVTAFTSPKSSNESDSSFATHAIDETNSATVNLSPKPSTAVIEPEKYAIFYKADESVISSYIEPHISQETTDSTVTTLSKNEPSSVNPVIETVKTESKNNTNAEVSVKRPVTTSNSNDSEVSQPKVTSSTLAHDEIKNVNRTLTSAVTGPPLLDTNIVQTTLPAGDFQNNATIASTTVSSTVSTAPINDTVTAASITAAHRPENTTKYGFTTLVAENGTSYANVTSESPNEANFSEIYTQKFVAHPVKLISTVNSVYMSPGLGFLESSLANKTAPSTVVNAAQNCTTEHTNSSTPYPPYSGVTSKHEDRKSNDSPWRNISLTNYKILLDSLIDGKVKPITRVPNVTIIPLSWLKGSAANAVTEKSEEVTTGGTTVLVGGRSSEQPNITETTVADSADESLKNESRQEPAQAKVYDPLMPYPEEYPEEYQTIQNGPSLIITRTTYTRIPDVTYTTVTMVTLPTYQQVQKAEDGFADTLFDRKFHERSFPNDDGTDTSSESPAQATADSYFNIDVTKIEEKSDNDVPVGSGKSLKKENQNSNTPRKGAGSNSKNEDSSIPMLDEKDMKIVQNFMNKNLRLH